MRSVAVVVQEGFEPFGLGCLTEVWGEQYHPDDDNPVFDFRVCTPHPGRVRGRSDFDLHVERGLEAAADADLVCFVPFEGGVATDPASLELARATAQRDVPVFAHCSAVFVLGEAGLLDGRECTTHWRHAAALQRAHPEAIVRSDVLYVHDGNVLTGAGSAASLDASLHLMRDWYGAGVAATTARRIVVPPYRDGGQAQYIARPIVDCDAATLGEVLAWARGHLHEDLDVDTLARQAHMSPRTFARRFRDETGTTPHAWVTRERLALAEEMLERTTNSVDLIAAETGFGSAATLRHHFGRARGVSPAAYRRQFAV